MGMSCCTWRIDVEVLVSCMVVACGKHHKSCNHNSMIFSPLCKSTPAPPLSVTKGKLHLLKMRMRMRMQMQMRSGVSSNVTPASRGRVGVRPALALAYFLAPSAAFLASAFDIAG